MRPNGNGNIIEFTLGHQEMYFYSAHIFFCLTEAEKREFVDAFPRPPSDITSNGDTFLGSGSFKKKSSTKSRSASLRPDIDDEVVKTAVFIKRAFMVSILFWYAQTLKNMVYYSLSVVRMILFKTD